MIPQYTDPPSHHSECFSSTWQTGGLSLTGSQLLCKVLHCAEVSSRLWCTHFFIRSFSSDGFPLSLIACPAPLPSLIISQLPPPAAPPMPNHCLPGAWAIVQWVGCFLACGQPRFRGPIWSSELLGETHEHRSSNSWASCDPLPLQKTNKKILQMITFPPPLTFFFLLVSFGPQVVPRGYYFWFWV